MGLFSTSSDTASKDVQELLLPGETLELQVKLVEDYLAVTDKRILFIDAEIGSSKREIVSIPFSRITEVSMLRVGSSFGNQVSLQVGPNRRKLTLSDKNESAKLYKLLTEKIL